MEFRIADTFTDSLTRLTGDEQKAVKTAAFDLQMNPTAGGFQMHRLEKSKDKNFGAGEPRSPADCFRLGAAHHSISRWSMRRRISVFRSCGFSLRWGGTGWTHCSSRVIWVSGSSRHPFRGKLWASMSGDGPTR
jgi:hypothetical protein